MADSKQAGQASASAHSRSFKPGRRVVLRAVPTLHGLVIATGSGGVTWVEFDALSSAGHRNYSKLDAAMLDLERVPLYGQAPAKLDLELEPIDGDWSPAVTREAMAQTALDCARAHVRAVLSEIDDRAAS